MKIHKEFPAPVPYLERDLTGNTVGNGLIPKGINDDPSNYKLERVLHNCKEPFVINMRYK